MRVEYLVLEVPVISALACRVAEVVIRAAKRI